MADYRLNGTDEFSGVFYRPDGISIPNDSMNRHWQEYLAWKALGNTPDPQYSTEEQAQINYQERQNARILNLKSALINQFKMILELFQVGRDKGLWVTADFDADLVTLAQEWNQLIQDYENDAP